MKDTTKALLQFIIGLPIVFAIMVGVLFFPAYDFTWLEGWLFIFIILTYAIIVIIYFLIKDPEVLVKRGSWATESTEVKSFPDKGVLTLFGLIFFFMFFFIPIDRTEGISPITIAFEIEILGFIVLIFSLIFMTYVMQVNKYASKGLVIHEDHELITSGPYQYIRHPMYLAYLLLFFSIPIALGSLIAFIISLLLPFIFAYRIRIEEQILIDHLNGYTKYMEQVKYRLIPKIY